MKTTITNQKPTFMTQNLTWVSYQLQTFRNHHPQIPPMTTQISKTLQNLRYFSSQFLQFAGLLVF